MKNKLTAFALSFVMCLSLIAPQIVLAETDLTAESLESSKEVTGNSEVAESSELENNIEEEESSEVDNKNLIEDVENTNNSEAEEEISAELSQESQVTTNSDELRLLNVNTADNSESLTAWSKLVDNVAAEYTSINVNDDITAVESDKDKTFAIKANQNIVLQGNGTIKGFGFNSIKVEKGGSLTIDGPTITNSQIIVEGTLNLKNGKIANTKLEGPTIFVSGGEFIMDGGEFSDNEAMLSENPQPDTLTKTGDSFNYAPITLYGGTLNILDGKIANNKGFLRGGAIGAWGTEASKVNVKISGGEITNNVAINDYVNAWGGAIYLDNTDFEINAGTISNNTAEYGGGIALMDSNAQITGGSINENSNGEYEGNGGGIYGMNSDIKIEAGNFTKNQANKHGGGLFLNTCNFTINGGYFAENSSVESGGVIATTGTSKGQINAGLFENNNSNGFWGGGAIYNDTKCELIINGALIKNNVSTGILIGAGNHPASRQGGGVWNCPTGHTEINITNGLALFDNEARNGRAADNNGAGDDFANITAHKNNEYTGKLSTIKLSPRMLGGGSRLWYQDGSFYGIHTNWPAAEQTPRYNPENPGEPLPYNTVIVEKKGAELAYKSVPAQESKDLAEQVATSIFRNNTAQGTGISGGAITNNGKLIFGEDNPYTIKITKAWAGDEEETRPEEIVLQMYVGEHYIEDVKLTKDGNWEATIKDFPDPDTLVDNKTGEVLPINFKEKDSGKYILSEVQREKDSEASVYTIDLENSIKTTINVNKVWEDNDDEAGLRPSSITVVLLANGEETGKTIELNEENNWEGMFKNLPSHKNGEKIEYTVKEVEIENGYTSTVTGSVEDGFTITNTREPEKTSIKVNKAWVDNNNQDGKRPDSITVKLFANGKEVSGKVLELNAENKWSGEFVDLYVYNDKEVIEYSIEEVEVGNGYTSKITGSAEDGFTITNTREPEKTSIKVNKVWEDNNNKDGKRPDSITVHLLRNGEKVDSKKLTKDNNWEWEFKELDKYEDGKLIEYRITEDKVTGYISKIDGFTITNSIEPEIPKTGASSSAMLGALLLAASGVILYLKRKNEEYIG